ncbi:MAG: hypothetical protein GY754_34100 [bacterium]|nr:hypothetical protein [bacterium]
MEASTNPIPYHIKGSKTYYQMCRGKKLIFEEVTHPGKLADSDFIDKDLLLNRFREIIKQTMRNDFADVVNFYFNRCTVAYIISNPDHEIIGLSISEVSFENGNQVLIPWLNIYMEEYRKYGIYIICVTKAIVYFIKEYQKINGLRGIKKLIPLFKKWFSVSRTYNPLIYCSMLRPSVKMSPEFDENGMIKNRSMHEDEREVRIDFLKKMGFKEEEINKGSLFLTNVSSNEKENKKMHENIPRVSIEPVNKFFKNHLGLDKGNFLVVTAAFRPAIVLPVDIFQKQLKKASRLLKKITGSHT